MPLKNLKESIYLKVTSYAEKTSFLINLPSLGEPRMPCGLKRG
jgi:hypothetical protein